MSTLRRLPSMEYAEGALSARSYGKGNLCRHLSLSGVSLCRRRHGLPLLPSRESFARSRSNRIPFVSPSCGHRRDGSSHRKLSSCRSLPSRAVNHREDRPVLSTTPSLSREAAQDIYSSLVYKDLSESIHLQMPGRDGCLPNSEGVLQIPSQDAGWPCQVQKPVETSASGVPMSLRMLKRRLSSKSEAAFQYPSTKQAVMAGDDCMPFSYPGGILTENMMLHAPGSVNSAFGTLIFMMESLQQYALRLRNTFASEADARFQAIMERVSQEMQETFLWLFQRVFACTPRLMLLTMLLLADFAVHSMGGHIAMAVPPLGEPPTYAIERSVEAFMLSSDFRQVALDKSSIDNVLCRAPKSNGIRKVMEPCISEGGAGGGVGKAVRVGGGMDDVGLSSNLFSDHAGITPQEETHPTPNRVSGAASDGLCNELASLEENQIFTEMWQQTLSKESISDSLTNSRHILVAPIRAPALEADNYTCYDRTDLNYQHELCGDPGNPLLLANYAQFQHVVRHDHDRADELYKRAVKADPADGELIGKYASFLWVAKEDLESADEAFKTALAVDPSNAYHAGSYAHFLWNSGVDQDNMSTPSMIHREVSAS